MGHKRAGGFSVVWGTPAGITVREGCGYSSIAQDLDRMGNRSHWQSCLVETTVVRALVYREYLE